MRIFINRYFLRFLFLLFIIFANFQSNFAYSSRIVAIVNNDVVTDVDVDDFEKAICRIDKRFKCGSQSSRQMALMSMVESVLKMEHFKEIKVADDKQLNRGYYEYKNNVLKSINIPAENISKAFEDYLHAEYIWNIMISSQVQQMKISDDDIEKFILRSGNKMNNVPRDRIRQLILQEKANEIALSTMAELKKFYLIDIRGL